jgi:hypothetical protein
MFRDEALKALSNAKSLRNTEFLSRISDRQNGLDVPRKSFAGYAQRAWGTQSRFIGEQLYFVTAIQKFATQGGKWARIAFATNGDD